MKNWLFSSALFALLLAGCASMGHMDQSGRLGQEGFDPKVVRRPQPLEPNVFIVEGEYIVIDQEPIRVPRAGPGTDERRVTIAWALEAGSPYTFPGEGGVNIFAETPGKPGPQNLNCAALRPQHKVFVCRYDRPPSGTRFKYSVTVMKGSTPLEKLDPHIMN